MNAPVVMLYFISVGVFALGSFQAAIMARSSNYTRACWTFSALCLGFSLFQLACGMQYSATSFQAALSAHKWVNFFSVVLLPLIFYLVASLESKPSAFRIAYAMAGIASLVIFYNFTSPFGYRFVQVYQDSLTSLPWGEQIWILSGEATWAFRAVRLMALGLIVYTLVFSFRLTRFGEIRSRRLIGIALFLMLMAGILAGLSDTNVIKVPYMGGFSFLFLAVSFAALVGKDVSNRHLEELEIYSELQQEIEGRKIANQRIEHVLNNDALTGLPNRAGALLGLHKLIELNRLNETKLGVFLFDVDQLGIINGTRGYKAGDQLLIEVAQRLQDNIRDADLLARLGSGRFVVGATGLKTERCVTLVYEKLSGALSSPFYIADSKANWIMIPKIINTNCNDDSIRVLTAFFCNAVTFLV